MIRAAILLAICGAAPSFAAAGGAVVPEPPASDGIEYLAFGAGEDPRDADMVPGWWSED